MTSKLVRLASLFLVVTAAGCATRPGESGADAESSGSSAARGTTGGQAQSRINGPRMLADVQVLASDSFAGRRVGTPGGLKARAYVERAMREAGLQSFAGSYLQPVSFQGRDSSTVNGANVVGYVRGTRNPDRYIVVSGHYDHLGIGRAVAGDSIYNGADDDASGTAGMLEVARYFAAHPPQHSMIFVGFDAEESGLRGARAFLASPPVASAGLVMNVNMDMVSRSEKGELYAVGTLKHSVLKPYIERAQARARVKLLTGHEGPGSTGSDNWEDASDHGPFNRAGIPYLYFGVEDHAGYHRPSDEFAFITPAFYVSAVETVLDVLLDLDRDLSAIAAARIPG